MAKQINQNRCIQCNASLPESPVEGITTVNAVFIIDPRLCTECAGMYARSLCSPTGTTGVVEPVRREAPDRRLSRAVNRHPGRLHRD